MDSRVFKRIPKNKRVYFRVTEPHKDGTPHLHISFFIPKEFKDSFINTLKSIFPAPQGKVIDNIDNPVAYLMKYILKTFDDYKEGDAKITDLTLWYAYWGISRIYTSRTLISLNVYRVLRGKFTMLHLTKMYKEKTLSFFIDPISKKLMSVLVHDEKRGTIPVWTKKEYMPDPNFNNMRQDDKPRLRKRKTPIPVTCEDKKFILVDNQLRSLESKIVFPARMADYPLYNYYHKLDIENCSLPHFGLVQNELIRRGLIQGKIHPLGDFNEEFYDEY